jgi:hypothetical protein
MHCLPHKIIQCLMTSRYPLPLAYGSPLIRAGKSGFLRCSDRARLTSAGSCSTERPYDVNTRQANRTCIALNTLLAPISRRYFRSYSRYTRASIVLTDCPPTWPQQGQVRLVFCGGTATRYQPRQIAIKLAAKLEPALIEDDFVETRFGLNLYSRESAVRAADLDIFRTFKSSTHAIPCFG